MQIRLANKEVVLSTQQVCLPVDLAGGLLSQTICFRVVPKLNHAVILGMQWLAEHNPSINWKSRTVLLSVDGDQVVLPCNKAGSNAGSAELCSAA